MTYLGLVMDGPDLTIDGTVYGVAINSIRAFEGSKKTLLMLIFRVLRMKIIKKKKNLIFPQRYC
jgi:hypothetical protein